MKENQQDYGIAGCSSIGAIHVGDDIKVKDSPTLYRILRITSDGLRVSCRELLRPSEVWHHFDVKDIIPIGGWRAD